MHPLAPLVLRDMCNASGRTTATNPVEAIVEAFKALLESKESEPLSGDDELLLFELSLRLMASGYDNLRAQATGVYTDLITLRGVEAYRPSVTEEELPQP